MQRTQAVNLLGGLAAASLLSAPFVFPFVAGIATWKIILGVIGLWIFVTAGIRR
jgi:hypothetical protein